MISPGRFWQLLRRDFKRGLSASRHHYRTLPQISKWSWAYWGEKPNPVPVHVLTGANDWLLAAWMLASLFHYSGQSWRIIVHDDGTLPEKAARILTEMFVSVRIIWRAEADPAVERALTPFPFCLDYRRSHPLALKVFDMPLFTESDRFLVLDSDLLFFARPEKIIQWSGQETDDCWFNEDAQENALVSAAEAAAELGVKLWPRVNSGLGLVARLIFDLDFCDRALARTTILRGELGRVEQTLFALCASRHGKGGLLPKSYEVSLHKHAAPGATSRHYVGAVRDRFYGEGLKRLRHELLFAKTE